MCEHCSRRHWSVVNDPLKMNISGRLMIALTQLRIRDARSLAIYLSAVCAVVQFRARTGEAVHLGNLEAFMDEQTDMLVTALRNQRGILNVPDLGHWSGDDGESAERDDACGTSHRQKPKVASGYKPVAKGMEEKLKDDRKPVQKLLLEDCVAARLVDLPKAEELIAGMSGKTPQQAELEIVEHLREELQGQVREYIRSDKGGPWSNPRTQEDLRQDIHAARTVRGVLLLCRQIVKEHRAWEEDHGHSGILGLFSPRRRSHGG